MSRVNTTQVDDSKYDFYVVRIPKCDVVDIEFRVTEMIIRKLAMHILSPGAECGRITMRCMHDAVQKVIDEKRDYIIERAIAYAGNRIKREINGLSVKEVLKYD